MSYTYFICAVPSMSGFVLPGLGAENCCGVAPDTAEGDTYSVGKIACIPSSGTKRVPTGTRRGVGTWSEYCRYVLFSLPMIHSL